MLQTPRSPQWTGKLRPIRPRDRHVALKDSFVPRVVLRRIMKPSHLLILGILVLGTLAVGGFFYMQDDADLRPHPRAQPVTTAETSQDTSGASSKPDRAITSTQFVDPSAPASSGDEPNQEAEIAPAAPTIPMSKERLQVKEWCEQHMQSDQEIPWDDDRNTTAFDPMDSLSPALRLDTLLANSHNSDWPRIIEFRSKLMLKRAGFSEDYAPQGSVAADLALVQDAWVRMAMAIRKTNWAGRRLRDHRVGETKLTAQELETYQRVLKAGSKLDGICTKYLGDLEVGFQAAHGPQK